MNVSWDPPFDGNSPITYYLVNQYNSFDVLEERRRTNTTFITLHLVYNKRYLVTVQAGNLFGVGNASEPASIFVNSTAPGTTGATGGYGEYYLFYCLLSIWRKYVLEKMALWLDVAHINKKLFPCSWLFLSLFGIRKK